MADSEQQRGPLLALVARGLELWLRQQCQAVEELELKLEGSMAGLLRGHLRGVRLQARRVVFQDLSLEWVELRSAPIHVHLGGLVQGGSLRLEQPFLVEGTVALTGEGLSRSLLTSQWRELGDQLSEGLLGFRPLQGLTLLDERLILQAQGHQGGEPLEVETRMELTPSGLQLRPLDGGPPLPLAMDPAIRLQRAEVRTGQLELQGEALVQP